MGMYGCMYIYNLCKTKYNIIYKDKIFEAAYPYTVLINSTVGVN